MDFGLLGLIASLILLTIFALKGMDLLIAAPICALVVALTNGLAIFASASNPDAANYSDAYLGGFGKFLSVWFLVFLTGALYGKLMEYSGGAKSIAYWIINYVGMKRAVTAVVLATGILTYGGVSAFIAAFAVYPLAASLFKQADLPHRFIPAALALGSVTFTMTSAGSMEIQNWLPAPYLGTTPYAAWPVSLVTAVVMAVAGIFWLNRMINQAYANGERFVLPQASIMSANEGQQQTQQVSPIIAFVSLIAVFITAFLFHQEYKNNALVIALLAGCLVLLIGYWPQLSSKLKNVTSEGTLGALVAGANTSAVVGFGTVVKVTPAFAFAVDAVTAIPGAPLVSAAIAVTVIAGITGSASGGQTIALPILGPIYLDAGANPEHLHRTISLSSGVLDSLPHNGYVVTLVRAICGETHQSAYMALAKMTMVVPAFCTIGAIWYLS
ncbi:GntP family permease [Thalassotalea sp. Y01]|uniref:GntP family permease n=1 Tax=Thalassotalea sp. Y01 TaxID=2729613 RepID=UPI00145ED52D|nr:GntP family permease [Thalassotalea sp. Y01]NMP15761.1 GntP family permease [Thalassotalea sp. Y01]